MNWSHPDNQMDFVACGSGAIQGVCYYAQDGATHGVAYARIATMLAVGSPESRAGDVVDRRLATSSARPRRTHRQQAGDNASIVE